MKVEDPPVVLVKGPSLVRVKALRPLLKLYPNQADTAYLLLGFTKDFHIPFKYP